jgi:hypothetical protein
MALPRFRPVESVRNPRHFGRVEHPEWDESAQLTHVERLWAAVQHQASFVVHQSLLQAGQTYEDLAANVGQSPSWVRRKLTGQVPADVGDLLAWSIACGVDVWPILETLTEPANSKNDSSGLD